MNKEIITALNLLTAIESIILLKLYYRLHGLTEDDKRILNKLAINQFLSSALYGAFIGFIGSTPKSRIAIGVVATVFVYMNDPIKYEFMRRSTPYYYAINS